MGFLPICSENWTLKYGVSHTFWHHIYHISTLVSMITGSTKLTDMHIVIVLPPPVGVLTSTSLSCITGNTDHSWSCHGGSRIAWRVAISLKLHDPSSALETGQLHLLKGKWAHKPSFAGYQKLDIQVLSTKIQILFQLIRYYRDYLLMDKWYFFVAFATCSDFQAKLHSPLTLHIEHHDNDPAKIFRL